MLDRLARRTLIAAALVLPSALTEFGAHAQIAQGIVLLVVGISLQRFLTAPSDHSANPGANSRMSHATVRFAKSP